MPNTPEHDQVARSYMQTTYLVELILKDQQDDVRDLVLDSLPVEQILPLLAGCLAFAAEVLRDQFGVQGALREIAKIRKSIGETGFEAVPHE